MPTTATQFTLDDYNNLGQVFATGDISTASKSELERYAVMLSRPNASGHFNKNSFPQVCETVRLLIIVRISEEANRDALRTSKIALVVAVIALVVSVVQTVVALRLR